MRLRAYLILMAAAILVPVIGFYAMALNMLENAGREAALQQLHEKANSFTLLVERELSSSEAALRVLATSHYLKNGDWAQFHKQAKSAVTRDPGAWTLLTDENGQQIVNTIVPFGTKLPPPTMKHGVQAVLASGKTVVSDVLLGPITGEQVTTVNVPVTLNNGKRYILTVAFNAEYFNRLITGLDLNPSWLAAILDSQGRFVARSLNKSHWLGRTARPEIVKAMQTHAMGVIKHRTLEDVEVYDAYKRITNTGWSVEMAAPVEEIDSAAFKAAKLAGAGMLGGILIALFFAFVFGGRIIRSIRNAGIAAIELGHGGSPHFGQSHIKEVNELYSALNDASKQLLQAREFQSEAEAKAVEAGERLDLAINAAELGTFYCPMPLGKIFWNGICKQHFFLPEDAEVDFELFYTLIHPDDRERIRRAVETAVFNRMDYDVEYRTMAPDGRTRWIRAKGRAYYDADGKPNRFNGITIDISRTKEVEERLERVSRQKDDFLAMLAHELRNPLAPISAAASLLSMPGVDQDRLSTTTEIIARQVNHMAGLLDDLLDVSRVTRGMIKLKKSAIDIKGVISAAAEQVSPLVQARKHHFSIELPAAPAYVFGDEKRLIQVIVNLLTNAAKYTPDNGSIRLWLETEAADILIHVNDNGIGIPPDLVGRIFELFVQGERTPDRQQGGLGLGLALVKSLVDLHNGEIWVSSEGTGKGSLFTIRLPRYRAVGQKNGIGAETPQVNASHPLLKIMVVDDNADAARVLSMFLEATGHEVQVEYDSTAALEKSLTIVPDVFILDIGMPGMDGNELARRLRKQSPTQHAALIALSGYGTDHDKHLSAAAGFDHHLIKPVDMRQLLSLIQNISSAKVQLPDSIHYVEKA
jgi:signal transduction histidine kinase/ActR/RegA family two-component response regulator